MECTIGNEGETGNFYYNLRRYQPLCYSRNGVPTFMILKEKALTSLPCIIFINVLYILVIVLEWAAPQSNDSQFNNIAKNINIIIALFVDIFYILTIVLNPGIVSQQDLQLPNGQFYSHCTRCNRGINMDMTHCIECETCVEDLDHHCSFFGKCIAGRQRFAFYGFITFIFMGFIGLMGSLAVLLNPS